MFAYGYKKLENTMKGTLKFYGSDYKDTIVWSTLETSLSCSGVNSAHDWQGIRNGVVQGFPGCLSKLHFNEANMYGAFVVILGFFLILKLVK